MKIIEVASAALRALAEEPPDREMVNATCDTLARHVVAQEAPEIEAAVVVEADHLALLVLTTARYGAVLKELNAADTVGRGVLEGYLDRRIAGASKEKGFLKLVH